MEIVPILYEKLDHKKNRVIKFSEKDYLGDTLFNELTVLMKLLPLVYKERKTFNDNITADFGKSYVEHLKNKLGYKNYKVTRFEMTVAIILLGYKYKFTSDGGMKFALGENKKDYYNIRRGSRQYWESDSLLKPTNKKRKNLKEEADFYLQYYL